MAGIELGGRRYDCAPGESVLDALLRQGVEVAHSCRSGACLTCLLRAAAGAPPEAAQRGLRPTLRDQGYFLACQCRPTGDLLVRDAADGGLYGRAEVAAVERLSPQVAKVALAPATELYYHPGQFVTLRRPADGLARSYSLASVPRLDRHLELHVKRLPGGAMSGWIYDELRAGQTLDLQGPNGACYYLPGRPDQALLLIGNGTGLAPLIGILRDALADGHRGPVHLYHGTRRAEGLYMHQSLSALAVRHDNVAYHPCLSGPQVAAGCRAGRAEAVAFADHPDLAGWRVFLCGYPPMVQAARRRAYLAGAALADIHADAFELRELRGRPRA
jgi:NAD(P)H-flavin reductase/ferredoxin